MAELTDPADRPLEVAIKGDHPTVVRLRGDIDIATSPVLEQALATVIASEPTGPIVFDFSHVGFVDSSGLAVLITVARAGHEVVVRGASDTVARVVEATGLTPVIHVEP